MDGNVNKDSEIISLALERYKKGFPDEINRREAIEDLKFLNGENQWEESILKIRKQTNRPCLVINNLPSFLERITGDQKRNKSGINLSPANEKSDPILVEIVEGLIRDILYKSKASNIFDYAFNYACACGFGFFRIVTEYENDKSFNQVLRLKKIRNSFNVLIDPEGSKDINYKNMNWAFISEYVSKKELKKTYPDKKFDDMERYQGEGEEGWYLIDKIKIVEYWIREKKTEKIFLLSDGKTIKEDWLKENKDFLSIMKLQILKEKKVDLYSVKQYIMTGAEILETNEWAGSYIPIIPVLGKELNIDGKNIYRGIIRHAKDPKRMHNYWRSAATEIVALAPKAPYLITPEQIEGHEMQWKGSVTNPNIFLKYNYIPNHPTPFRNSLDNLPQGVFTEIQSTLEDIKSTIGFDNMPIISDRTSGVAFDKNFQSIGVTQYEYVDNLNIAIEHCGDLLLDIIPKIYDTERKITIKDKEDKVKIAQINKLNDNNEIINDLTSGLFDTVLNVGPNFTTQRNETVYGMEKLLQVMPDSAKLFLDILAENLNWPGSQKIAKRYKIMLPPEIKAAEEGMPMPQPQPDSKSEVEMRKYDVEEKRLLVELERIKMELDKIYSQNITDKKQLRQMMIEVMKEVFEPNKRKGGDMNA